MATCAPSNGDGEARRPSRGADLSIPNLITLGRILLVPVVVWAITAGEMRVAFVLFLAAGISDAVDGFLAKRFGMATELGAYLDPLADKAMLVSIYVALGIADAVPGWLVILIVSRDIMIVSAVILSWLVDKPIALKPLLVSKLNTVAQIALACVIMAARGFGSGSRAASGSSTRRMSATIPSTVIPGTKCTSTITVQRSGTYGGSTST
jgi:cardiolipin synthase